MEMKEQIEQTMVLPADAAPWRRFFARSLDYIIYEVLWGVFLTLVFCVNTNVRSIEGKFFDFVVVIILMLLLEPAFLAMFGTTLGKWILGLHIEDRQGRRLSYREAYQRGIKLLWNGNGLYIPIYCQIRLYKCYCQCKEGESLYWEEDSRVVLRDKKKWRIPLYIAAYVAIITISVLAQLIVEMPKHRGDISAEQFCENYNRLSSYYKEETELISEQPGKLKEKVDEDEYVMNLSVPRTALEYSYTEKNGVMTSLCISEKLTKNDRSIPSRAAQMSLSIKSFVEAQKQSGLFSDNVKDIMQEIIEEPFRSFEYHINGIKITCDLDYYGYEILGDECLFPEEWKEKEYNFVFKMEKE